MLEVEALEAVSEQALIDPAPHRAVDPVSADFAPQLNVALGDDVFDFDVTFILVKVDLFVSQY